MSYSYTHVGLIASVKETVKKEVPAEHLPEFEKEVFKRQQSAVLTEINEFHAQGITEVAVNVHGHGNVDTYGKPKYMSFTTEISSLAPVEVPTEGEFTNVVMEVLEEV